LETEPTAMTLVDSAASGAYASGMGLRVLEAQLLAEQAWIAGLLRPHGACSVRPAWGGVLHVTVRLGEASA
jgi:hypothetical protein